MPETLRITGTTQDTAKLMEANMKTWVDGVRQYLTGTYKFLKSSDLAQGKDGKYSISVEADRSLTPDDLSSIASDIFGKAWRDLKDDGSSSGKPIYSVDVEYQSPKNKREFKSLADVKAFIRDTLQ